LGNAVDQELRALARHLRQRAARPAGTWFGRIANRLEGYADTLNLKCHVLPQDWRQRPLVRLEATDHPLAVEQQTGITFDRLLELYALNGHDLSAAFASG